MGSVVSYLNYVYMENPEGKSLTSMTVYAGRTVVIMTIRCGTLRKSMETLRKGVSDRHNGYAGKTIEFMTVRRRCPFEDT